MESLILTGDVLLMILVLWFVVRAERSQARGAGEPELGLFSYKITSDGAPIAKGKSDA